MRFGHGAAWWGGVLSPPGIPLLLAASPLPDQLQAGLFTLGGLSLCSHEPVSGLESYSTSSLLILASTLHLFNHCSIIND